MSDQLVIAVIGALAGLIGGVIGAIAAPLGKDWVARQEADRIKRLDEERRAREATAAVIENRRRVAAAVLDHMGTAMENYALEWRGNAQSGQGRPRVISSATAAWNASTQLDDAEASGLVDAWKRQIDIADMGYRNGQPPPGIQDVEDAYRAAATALGQLLAGL